MRIRDVAWLAGLLEGEGTFCLDARKSDTGRRRPHLVLALQMCDEDVVRRAATLMDGNVTTTRRVKLRPNESPSWRVKIGGARAERVMRLIREFMGQRRGAKIDELLAMKGLSHHAK